METAHKDQRLWRLGAAKALDIPWTEDMGPITVTNTRSGVPWPVALAVALIGPAAMAGALWLVPFLQKLQTQKPPVEKPPVIGTDSDTKYRIRPLPGE